MNKKFYLLLSLLFLMVIPVFADYNFTCVRDCDTIANTYCNTTLGWNDTEVFDEGLGLSKWFYTGVNNQTANISVRTPFFTTPDLTGVDLNLESCKVGVLTAISTAQPRVNGLWEINQTLQLLNGSSTSFTEHTCTNETFILHSSDDICMNDSSVIDYIIRVYDSVDGSCSGNLLSEYPDVLPFGERTCDNNFEFSSGYDKEYFALRFDVVEDLIIYNYYSFDGSLGLYFGNVGEEEYVADFDVNCDGTAYAWIWNRTVLNYNASTNFPSTASWYHYNIVNGNVSYTYCFDYETNCIIWDEPYNDTYLYSCECPPAEDNLGLFCEDDECLRYCSGDLVDNPLYVPIPYNETLEGVFEGGDASEVIGYFGSESTDFLGGWMDEYVGLAFYFIIIIAVLSVIGIIVALVKGK